MVSPPRQVVVDDTDLSQLTYSPAGSWDRGPESQDSIGNFGPRYNKTSHGPKANGSISFSFEGSSVTVWGMTKITQINNGISLDPSWECFVDLISIGTTKPFTSPENNWALCEQNTLKDGSHILTIDITSTGDNFWFDYLTYTPSPTVSVDTAVLLVQNTDSAVLYDDGWGELGGTANMTTKVGSEVKFNFVGTSLAWVGYIPTESPHNASLGSYSIDSGVPKAFILKGLSPTATTTIYNQAFFTVSDLAAGPHTILVTYEGGDGPSTPLTLDYLLITNTSLPVTANTTATSSSSSSSAASSVPTSSPTTHTSTPVGPIVGGVVGGLAAIAILLFALWWWRRRRATRVTGRSLGLLDIIDGTGQPQMTRYTDTPYMQPLQAEAFTSSYPSTGKSGRSANVQSRSDVSYTASSSLSPNNDLNNSSSGSLSYAPTHTRGNSAGALDASEYAVGTVEPIRAIRKSGNMPPGPTITSVVHQDSGLRLRPPQLDVIVEDVPPMYTAV